MKKLLATALIAFALATPATAFDIGSIDGIPSDIKETIAKQSGGRVTNKQGQPQAGQDGQQQQQQQRAGRQSRKKLSAQDKAMQQADQFMNGGGDSGGIGGQGIGQGLGSFR